MKKYLKKFLGQKDSGQILKNVIGNYMVKGLAMIITIMLTPAYMSYFSSDKLLGMWFTVIALINLMITLDFGIGGGVRNQMVLPYSQNNKKVMKEIISSSFISIGGVVILLLIIQGVVVEIINWYPILGVESNDISENTLKIMIHILMVGIIIRFFSVLILHILYAMQQATLVAFLILLSNVIVLIYMLIVKPTGNENDIINLALIQALAYNLPTLITMAILFCTKLKGTFASFKSFRMSRVKAILGTGLGIFYVQILIVFVFGVKEIFINWFTGASQVVEYNIYQKLIGIVAALFGVAITPMWSAVTKAYDNNDGDKIKKYYLTFLTVIGIFSVGQLLIVGVMPILCKIWLGKNAIEVSYFKGILFSLYNMIYMVVLLNYNFECGMTRTKKLGVGLTIALIINVILSYWWTVYDKDWIIVIISTSVSAIPCIITTSKDIVKVIKNKVDNV